MARQRMSDGTAFGIYHWLDGDELDAPEKITENIENARGYVDQAVENITNLSTDWIFADNIPDLVMPTVNWNSLDPGGVMSYFNTIYDRFLYPPINTKIIIEDVPDLTVPDVDYTYDTEPMDVMKAKIKADIAASSFGPETADRTGLDTRAAERAGMLSGALTAGAAGAFSGFGMVFPTTAKAATAAEYAKRGAFAMSSASQGGLIAYSDAWSAGKKMTIASGLEVNKAIFQEFAIKLEALLDVFNAKIDGYLKRAQAKTLLVGYEYDHFVARTKAYSAMVGAMSDVIALSEKNLDMSMSVYKRRIEIAVDAVKATIEKLTGIAEIHVGAEKAVFDANRAVATGALSVMNVQAAVSSSVSGSNSNSSSASASKSANASESVEYDTTYTYEE